MSLRSKTPPHQLEKLVFEGWKILEILHMSSEEIPDYLLYIGGFTTQFNIGFFFLSQYKAIPSWSNQYFMVHVIRISNFRTSWGFRCTNPNRNPLQIGPEHLLRGKLDVTVFLGGIVLRGPVLGGIVRKQQMYENTSALFGLVSYNEAHFWAVGGGDSWGNMSLSALILPRPYTSES